MNSLERGFTLFIKAYVSKLSINPQVLPVEGLAGEAPIPSMLLEPQWIRRCFSISRDWTEERLPDARLKFQETDLTPAAVLVPIVMREEGLTVLLTKRAEHLHDHAGQISLPGGRIEVTDEDAIDAALREAQEEVGLQRSAVEVLGNLPGYITGSGYAITPVVALVSDAASFAADPFEVAEIFEVPLSFLVDGQNHERRSVTFPDGSHRVFYAMPYGSYFIWGATAGILRNLFHFMRARV